MTYTFKASLQEEDDGRWSAWIDSLPGCAAWGYTRDEALEALQEGGKHLSNACGKTATPSLKTRSKLILLREDAKRLRLIR